MRIFEHDSHADEDIVVEYVSGVLASSRTEEGRDDRGVGWSSPVARMSCDQLRLHYVLYSNARAVLL
jgi:hypothetical protein